MLSNMSHFGPKIRLVCLLSPVLCDAVGFAVGAGPRTDDFDFFEKKIRPVLVERCYQCHSASAEKVKGGLMRDSREGVIQGGDWDKPAVVAGGVERSRLIYAIRYTNDDLQMPPKQAGGKFSDEQISDFIVWINLGAPHPR